MGVQSMTGKHLGLGPLNFEGLLGMTNIWPVLILRFVWSKVRVAAFWWITGEYFFIGTWNLVGTLVITSRWLILRSFAQRSRSPMASVKLFFIMFVFFLSVKVFIWLRAPLLHCEMWISSHSLTFTKTYHAFIAITLVWQVQEVGA